MLDSLKSQFLAVISTDISSLRLSLNVVLNIIKVSMLCYIRLSWCLGHLYPIQEYQFESRLLCCQNSFLLMHLERLQIMAQVLGSVPSMCETPMKFDSWF